MKTKELDRQDKTRQDKTRQDKTRQIILTYYRFFVGRWHNAI